MNALPWFLTSDTTGANSGRDFSSIKKTSLGDGQTESASLTYQELELQARAIACQLLELGATGERALLPD